MERSRIPLIAIFSVRGIGVAVSVRISTSARIALIRSLWRTPKRCSSSTISRPRSRSFTSLCSSLCVPIRISILPSAASAGFVSALWRCESGTASQCVPASWRNGRGSYHSVAAPAAWSAPVPLLVYGFPLPERGAHRHFGFAEADVAAHQPVHRQRLAHIAQYGVNRLCLIGRRFKRKLSQNN